jgi:hypothetical protein
VAVLGVGLASPQLARRLNHAHHDSRLRVAFDADPRGLAARDALLTELNALEHPDAGALDLPAGLCDLNDWLRRDSNEFARSLEASARVVAPPDLGIHLDR